MAYTLLVIGAGGFVGGVLAAKAVSAGWSVAGADRVAGTVPADIDWHTLDITSDEEIIKTIDAVRPDVVVCTAAIADVDAVQRDQERAWKINVEGPRQIARHCHARAIRFVFISSDAVYRGDKERYTETDTPDPVNYYGYTKAEAENAVLDEDPASAVVRLSLVLGLPLVNGNSFVARLLSSLKNSASVTCPVSEIRTPVDIHTLCDSLLELCANGFSGVLHLGATGSINRFELGQRIATIAGFDPGLIIAQNADQENSGRAPRHRNGILDVRLTQTILTTQMLSVDETIRKALQPREAGCS